MSDTRLEKILILDDNSDYRKLIKTFISKLLPSVEAIEYDPVFEGVPDDDFNWSEIDVLLLDYHLSIVGTTGLDILHKHHKKPSFPATIMLTGAGTEEVAVRALKTGIYEYQPKQSLTKDKLKQSIIHAWEDKKSQRKKQQEITQHNKSFSKQVFYENLENTLARKEIERTLVIIKPDNIEELEQLIGIIGRDSLVNHIGKNSFDVFKLGACNPNITRTSDTAIAVQIDSPVNQETLEFNMQGLCKHLAKCTFKFSDEKYKFTVSIGLLKLDLSDTTAEKLIQIATAASQKASDVEGNSFYIWKETDVLPVLNDSDTHTSTEQVSISDAEKQINAERENLKLELKAVEEAKNKLKAELKAAEDANTRAEEALNAATKAKEKAEAEAEAKERAELEARERAEAEAKERAEFEARERAEAEAKERAELEAKLKAETEAKERAELETKERAEAKAKERAELEARERSEAEAKERAELETKERAETEARERAELETKLAIAAKEKMEAELKAIIEAKEKAETEMKAAKEAKEKLEAELKVILENNNTNPATNNKSEQISTESTSNNKQADDKKENEVEATAPVSPSIEEVEEQIKKLIDEKRIIQTYQPVMAMFDDDGDSNIELYKTGLKAIIEEDNELNEMLSDISKFSLSLQKIINEWILRQIFLRITESAKAECKNHFLVSVTEAWFLDISLFNWLQKILSQTKKYAPGKSIILNVPIDIFNKYQKRAKPLIDTLHKSYNFRVAISNIESLDTISTDCQSTSSKILMLSVDKLQQLTAMLGPENKTTGNDNDEGNNEKQNLLQYLKTKGIHIITSGIEDATLLTDAITNGTDYAIGSFIGEVQNSLVEPGTVETFDLT
jgi:CheY-like chemotaxis protein